MQIDYRRFRKVAIVFSLEELKEGAALIQDLLEQKEGYGQGDEVASTILKILQSDLEVLDRVPSLQHIQ